MEHDREELPRPDLLAAFSRTAARSACVYCTISGPTGSRLLPTDSQVQPIAEREHRRGLRPFRCDLPTSSRYCTRIIAGDGQSAGRCFRRRLSDTHGARTPVLADQASLGSSPSLEALPNPVEAPKLFESAELSIPSFRPSDLPTVLTLSTLSTLPTLRPFRPFDLSDPSDLSYAVISVLTSTPSGSPPFVVGSISKP